MKNKESSQHVRIIDKIAMFMIGIINNTPFVIGIASAQRIVKNYNVDSYLGIVLWANTISGIFSRFLNSFLISLNIPYEVNFVINLVMMLFGLVTCAFAKVFWLTCVSVFFIGFSSNLGESVMLCYMTHRKKQALLKSWSSGTGMAGIAGAGYSFFCDIVEISLFWSFIGVSPVVIIYGLLFFFVIRKSPDAEADPNDSMMQPMLNNETGNSSSNYSMNSMANSNSGENLVVEKVRVCDCSYFHNMWFYIFNCGFVYFLEYSIQGVFADCCLTGEKLKKYHYMFSLLNLCYQIGVFISRSSLTFFQFKKIWILTIGQAGFFALWFTQAFYHFMPVGALWGTMVCVGLFGGCSYVNAFHLMMNEPRLSTKQKEMVTSWNSFFISFNIICSTAFTFVSELTYLKPPVIPDDNGLRLLSNM
ncbi:CLN3 protein [Tritrichomonas foetus]|uniref:CLN3 protein n=1 Tax=Tritrichomonas foetus TaxID=1144522 RepID=A0A1J4JY06_9EUKA|nr:CLN3 protein [Tritrichomonas foetus]|eukprot:OHT03875.1 CLN3 protein [Tritrichomonas foetus]